MTACSDCQLTAVIQRGTTHPELMLSALPKLDHTTRHTDDLGLILTLPSSHSGVTQSAACKYTNFHRLLISLFNTTFSAIRYQKAPAGSSCMLFLFFFRCEEVDIYRLYKQERRLAWRFPASACLSRWRDKMLLFFLHSSLRIKTR